MADSFRVNLAGHAFGFEPLDLGGRADSETGVANGFGNRQVRVGHRDVLANYPDAQRLGRGVHAARDLFPVAQVNGVFRHVNAQGIADNRVQTLTVEFDRQVIDTRDVHRRNHGVGRHVTEQRDLALETLGDRLIAATDNDVGLNTARAQLGHRVLRGLGLLFARRREVRHERQVYVTHVVAAHVTAVLAN